MKWQVELDGQVIEVDSGQLGAIQEVEPGVYVVLQDGKSMELRVERSDGGLAVYLGGRRVRVDLRDPRDLSKAARHALGSGRQNVVALMPGKVIRVLVAPGQAVETGAGLVVVEAMKMQNEMKATRPGRVAEVCVKSGDTVSAGETLLVLE